MLKLGRYPLFFVKNLYKYVFILGSAIVDANVTRVIKMKENVSARTLLRRRRANNELPEESAKRIAKTMMRRNAMILMENSTAWAFRWCKNAFFCSYCHGKFYENKTLQHHVVSNHLQEQPTVSIFSKITENNMLKIEIGTMKCRLCNIYLESIDHLKTHIIQAHDKCFHNGYSDGVLPFKFKSENVYDCQMCKESFNSFTNLNQHMNIHYQNYICDACGKAFISKPRFRIHVQTHEIGSFACRDCGEVFDTRVARVTHRIKVHRRKVRYTCPKCCQPFTTYYSRSKHLVEEHHEKSKEYSCSFCSKIFATSCKRAAHVRAVHKYTSKRHSRPFVEFCHPPIPIDGSVL